MTVPSTDKRPDEATPDASSESAPFRLTNGWLIVGLLMILVGIGCGLVMSSATFAN